MRRPRAPLVLLLIVLALGVGAAAACGGGTSGPVTPSSSGASVAMLRVGIAQFSSLPAFNQAIAAFKEALAAAGFREGVNVTYEVRNAGGDAGAAATLAAELAGGSLDLILGVSTPVSQALQQATTDTPIVFVAVTDPVGAGLVTNPESPDGNLTGVANLVPMARELTLVKQIVPAARRVGILYNPAEAQSVLLVGRADEAAADLGLTVVAKKVAATAAAGAAARTLAGQVDAMLVMTDATALAAIDDVAAACRKAGVPLLSGDLTAIARAAVAGYVFDVDALGYEAGAMGAAILAGKPVAEVPVVYSQDMLLAVNRKAAQATRLMMPTGVLEAADRLY